MRRTQPLASALRVLAVAAVAAGLLAGPAAAREIYVANSGSDSVSVIESSSNAVVGTVPVGDAPAAVAISPDGSRALVVNEGDDTVSVVDVASDVVVGTPIAVGDEPRGIALTPDGSRAYVANAGSDSVSVIDPRAGAAILAVPLAAGAEPEGIAIAPDGATAFVAQRGGDLAMIATGTNRLAGFVKTIAGVAPSSISIEPTGGRGFVTNSASSSISVFDARAGTILGAPLQVGPNPAGVAVNPNGPQTYVAVRGADTVAAIDTLRHTTFGSPVPGFQGPTALAIAPDGARAYVADSASSTVTVLDTLTNAGAGKIGVGSAPKGIAIVPDQGPRAAFSIASGQVKAGAPALFDARASMDPDGTVSSYAWQFGDGEAETTAGPLTEHVYAKPGAYAASVTVTDAEGCAEVLLFTGQTVSCNGSGAAVAAARVEAVDATPPELELIVRRRQPLRRSVLVTARCPQERCDVTIGGRLTASRRAGGRAIRRKAKTATARAHLANGIERGLRLRLPRRAFRAARGALAANGKATVGAVVGAADAAGNQARRKVRIILFAPPPRKAKGR
jgi:YVTN family beta-propeller protein